VNYSNNDMTKINRNPARSTLDATDMDWLIEQFLIDCSKRVQPVTVKNYRDKLSHFLAWWSEAGPEKNYILTEDDFVEYKSFLNEKKILWRPEQTLAWHTKNDALRRVATVLRWAHKNDYIEKDYSHWVPELGGRPEDRELFSATEIPKLLRAALKTAKPIRNQALLYMMIGTGARRTEVSRMNMQDVHIEDDRGYVVIRSRLKKGPTRKAAIAPEAAVHLNQYIEWMHSPFGPLFPGRSASRPLASGSVYRIVADCYRIAGIEVNDPCHDLRRLFCTTWSKQYPGEGGIITLGRQVGHTTINMTSQYIYQRVEELQDYVTNLHFG